MALLPFLASFGCAVGVCLFAVLKFEKLGLESLYFFVFQFHFPVEVCYGSEHVFEFLVIDAAVE